MEDQIFSLRNAIIAAKRNVQKESKFTQENLHMKNMTQSQMDGATKIEKLRSLIKKKKKQDHEDNSEQQIIQNKDSVYEYQINRWEDHGLKRPEFSLSLKSMIKEYQQI